MYNNLIFRQTDYPEQLVSRRANTQEAEKLEETLYRILWEKIKSVTEAMDKWIAVRSFVITIIKTENWKIYLKILVFEVI